MEDGTRKTVAELMPQIQRVRAALVQGIRPALGRYRTRPRRGSRPRGSLNRMSGPGVSATGRGAGRPILPEQTRGRSCRNGVSLYLRFSWQARAMQMFDTTTLGWSAEQ